MRWVAVVPVKGSPHAKSRFGDHPERARLADAFALDTVAALLAASVMERVFVVTADASLTPLFTSLGAVVVRELPEKAPSGPPKGPSVAIRERADPLNAAIRQGVDAARAGFPECGIAVVTGDLPALTVADVEAALGLAAAHRLSMVADEEGTGTTALLALAGVPFSPSFGPGSSAAHEAAGHVPLPLPATASIRRDVDTVDNLAEALHHGVGVHTSALIAATSAAEIDGTTGPGAG